MRDFQTRSLQLISMDFEPCEIKRKMVRVLIDYVRKALLKITINLSSAITLSVDNY